MAIKNEGKRFTVCFLVACLFLLIGSKSSPLYPFNDWADVNCIFTVGKGMMNGYVPYRDLYDQKGPLLFFIYGLAWLISHESFIGLFIFEVLAMTVYLFYAIKTIDLLAKRANYSVLPLLLMLILTSNCFNHGGSAEQLCMPFNMFALYSALCSIMAQKELSIRQIALHGFLAACIAWIKYSLLGVYLGWILLLIYKHIKQKQFKALGVSALCFLGGAIVATLPWLVYYALNGALHDLYIGYFYNNMFIYNTTHMNDTQALSFLGKIVTLLYGAMVANLTMSISVIIGILFVLFKAKWQNIPYLIPYLSFTLFSLVLCTYGGGVSFRYYFLSFSVLLPLGVALLNQVLSTLQIKRRSIRISLIGFAVVACLPLTYFYSTNTYMLFDSKQEVAQYRLAEKIDKVNPSIMHLGVLDIGMNTLTGAIPDSKYFCTLNVHLPEMTKQQDFLLQQGLVDYIVERPFSIGFFDLSIAHKYAKYELIAKEPTYYEGIYYEIKLYRLKEASLH